MKNKGMRMNTLLLLAIIGTVLVVLFSGSSSFGEEISMSKYPAYAEYRKSVPRFFPSFK